MVDFLLYTSLYMIWFMLIYHLFLMQGGYLFSLKYPNIQKMWLNNVPEQPTVSILIPAHNEEMVIQDTIQAMIQLNYPKDKLEVIIINDRSSDATGAIAESFAAQYPFIHVVHTKPPYAGKGKSSALNQGFKQSTGEIIVVYDADNTPEPDAVRNLVLALQKDKKAGATVGKFRVTNARKNMLTRFINIETLTFQWLAQAGRWYWFKMTTIPGTNFAIKRSILEQLGGWDEKALSEDTELTIRVYNLGYHIRFAPTAVTWEQEPELWKVWWKQRTRWARGNLYVIAKYMFKFHELKNKKVFIDFIYFIFTYFVFFSGILVSHSIFLLGLFGVIEILIGVVSIVLLIVGFLLFVTEVMLALSYENNQLNFKNVLMVLLMYFTYSQMWLFLVAYAFCVEVKCRLMKQEVQWYKTQRFKNDEYPISR